MCLFSITLARITTVRFCVNGTGEAMRTSPYLPFAKSIVPLALSILLVTASPPRGRYWYNVDTPDLEPLHSILISRHPVWGWLYGAGRRDGLRHVARAPNTTVAFLFLVVKPLYFPYAFRTDLPRENARIGRMWGWVVFPHIHPE